jgi:hypothetical protein
MNVTSWKESWRHLECKVRGGRLKHWDSAYSVKLRGRRKIFERGDMESDSLLTGRHMGATRFREDASEPDRLGSAPPIQPAHYTCRRSVADARGPLRYLT